ncbi:MAG TPA: ABC transporter ATP-binding protein [Candidatus Binatia bacterium]|nr:ABC transporter ATP-binding protein [Candidatus Binatia bacterium]
MSAVRIQGLRKTFAVADEKVEALKNIQLEVEEGEFFVFLGSSGSGKSTLIRCIAGLEEPDDGEICLGSEIIFSKARNINLDPAARSVGMVFQSYAIWPHLTVLNNVMLPLVTGRMRLSKPQANEKARQALQAVEMETLAERPASLLSGGQQQRVAVARALATDPKVLLMDEPLSNLDARLREQVRHEISRLARRTGITVLYVTHDQIEAMAVATRIATLAHGEVLQVSEPAQLYEQPANVSVAQFMGSMNWLHGKVERPGLVRTDCGELRIMEQKSNGGNHFLIGIRPEHLRLTYSREGKDNEFEGEIISRTFLGDQIWYEIQIGEKTLLWKTMSSDKFEGKVYVQLPRAKLQVFPEQE